MHLLEIPIDFARLIEFTASHSHLKTADEDLGYAMHAWLAATLGADAVLAFHNEEWRSGFRLFVYSPLSVEEARRTASTIGSPLALSVSAPETWFGKEMRTDWQAGERVPFTLRACPVSRNDRERDVYLVELEYLAKNQRLDPKKKPTKERIYSRWLKDQLARAGAINPDTAKLSVRSTRLVTTTRQKHGVKERIAMAITRPDALFVGSFEVADPQAFNDLLNRGVGRHRSFGFGMLMLRN